MKRRPRGRGAGFTLLELLVVMALMALATAGVGLAVSSFDRRPLEQDAQRLAAHLDAARAQAWLRGEPIEWRADAEGYWLGRERHRWLTPGVSAALSPAPDALAQPAGLATLLPPEPIMPAIRIALRWQDQTVVLQTDGAGPFDWQ